MDASIFFVTVNWNHPNDTCECIQSLLEQENVSPNIIVVDNGSTDNSIDIISNNYKNIQLIPSHKNLGFAGGFNLGIRSALSQGASHILIINNDTIASPSMFQALITEIKKGEIGVTAPVIYYASDPTKTWSCGGMINPFLLEPINSHHRDCNILRPEFRTFLSGCCLLIKREVLDEIGLFDERFFLYYEDLDFCLRIKNSRWKMIIVPDAKLWHKVSVSSGGELSANERYYMARSSGLYFRKHMRIITGFFIIPFRLSSALLWSFRLIVKKNWIGFKAYWKGLYEGWLENENKIS